MIRAPNQIVPLAALREDNVEVFRQFISVFEDHRHHLRVSEEYDVEMVSHDLQPMLEIPNREEVSAVVETDILKTWAALDFSLDRLDESHGPRQSQIAFPGCSDVSTIVPTLTSVTSMNALAGARTGHMAVFRPKGRESEDAQGRSIALPILRIRRKKIFHVLQDLAIVAASWRPLFRP